MTFIAEAIYPCEPRPWKFDEAKKEMKGLFNNGTWKIVCRERFFKNAKVLNKKLILAIKDERTKIEVRKARIVRQEQRGETKTSLVYDTSVSKQQ